MSQWLRSAEDPVQFGKCCLLFRDMGKVDNGSEDGECAFWYGRGDTKHLGGYGIQTTIRKLVLQSGKTLSLWEKQLKT